MTCASAVLSKPARCLVSLKHGNQLAAQGLLGESKNLDKIITTGIPQGKDNNIAPRLVIYFNLTSADKSWCIGCTDISLMDSEISDNRSLIIQTPTTSPQNNELKYYKSVGRTQREINIYSQQ